MALYPAPATLLVPAIALDAIVVALVARRAPRGEGTNGLAIQAIVLWVLLEAASLALFGSWDRQWPVALGLLLGLLLGLSWEWRWPKAPLAAAACGLVALGLLGLIAPGGVALANAGLGLVAAWGTVALLARLQGVDAPASGLAFTALIAGAIAWGERLNPGVQLGAPFAVAVGTAVVLGLGLMRLLEGRTPAWLSAGLGFVVAGAASGILALGVYGLHTPLWLAILLGGIIGAIAPLLVNGEGPPGPLPLLLIGGAALVCDNRLFGILGIALGGAGLLLGSRGKACQPLALLLAVFAARVWMQLFLARTLLTGYGIDLTHPYAFAGLVIGGLLPAAAIAIARLCRDDGWLLAGAAFAIVALPAWLGYFVHVEPLASLLAGLVLASFLTAMAPSSEVDTLAPVLLLTTTATTLLAAPWLVTVMNATRGARLVVLLVIIALALVAYVRWLWRLRRAPAAA